MLLRIYKSVVLLGLSVMLGLLSSCSEIRGICFGPNPDNVNYELSIDGTSPVPLVDGQPRQFYVYVTNIGKGSAKNLVWSRALLDNQPNNILTRLKTALIDGSTTKGNVGLEDDGIRIINSDDCSGVIAPSQSCRILMQAKSPDLISLQSYDPIVNGVTSKSVVSAYIYPKPAIPASDAILTVSPINEVNYGNGFTAFTFFIINNNNTSSPNSGSLNIDQSSFLGQMPAGIDYNTLIGTSCVLPLAAGDACQVRLIISNSFPPSTNNPPLIIRPQDSSLPAQVPYNAVISSAKKGVISVTQQPSMGDIAYNGTGIVYGWISNTGSGDLIIKQLTTSRASVLLLDDGCSNKTLAVNATCRYTLSVAGSSISSGGSASVSIPYNDTLADGTTSQTVGWGYIPPTSAAPAISITGGAGVTLTQSNTTGIVNLENTGNVVLTSVTRPVSSNPSVDISGDCVMPLAIGASCAYVVTYIPMSPSQNSSVTISGSNVGYVDGNGVSKTETLVSSTGFNVSSVFVGRLITDAANVVLNSTNGFSKTITITNTGNADAIISDIQKNNNGNANLTFTGGTCTNTALAPLATCTIMTQLTNITTSASDSGSVNITYNDSNGNNGQTSSSLRASNISWGVGDAPNLAISYAQSSLSTTVGVAQDVLVTLKNEGNNNLTNITFPVLTNAELSWRDATTSNCNRVGIQGLTPGASCVAVLRYLPTAVRSNSLETFTNKFGSQYIPLYGANAGIAQQHDVVHPAITLGAIAAPVNTANLSSDTANINLTNSTTMTITISNTGTANATFSNRGFSAGSTNLEIKSGTCTNTTVLTTAATPASNSCTIVVGMINATTPAGTGSGSVVITYNNNVIVAPYTATVINWSIGIVPALGVVSSPNTSYNVPVNPFVPGQYQSGIIEITLTNNGNNALNNIQFPSIGLTANKLSWKPAPTNSCVATGTQNLLINQSCNIVLEYAPTTVTGSTGITLGDFTANGTASNLHTYAVTIQSYNPTVQAGLLTSNHPNLAISTIAPTTVTLTNTGNADVTNLATPSLINTLGTNLEIKSGGSCVSGMTIYSSNPTYNPNNNPTTSCTVLVGLKEESVPGNGTGTLSVAYESQTSLTTNYQASSITWSIGAIPGLNVVYTPASANIFINSDTDMVVTLSNTGNANLSNILFPGLASGLMWELDTSSPSTACVIDGTQSLGRVGTTNASCTARLKYSPTAVRASSAESLASFSATYSSPAQNYIASPTSVTLSAVSDNSITFEQSALAVTTVTDYANWVSNTPTTTFEVRNTSAIPITMVSATLGLSTASIGVNTCNGTTLAQNATCSISISSSGYTSATIGTVGFNYTANGITDNDDVLNVSINYTAKPTIAENLTVTAPTARLTVLNSGAPTTYELTVTNDTIVNNPMPSPAEDAKISVLASSLLPASDANVTYAASSTLGTCVVNSGYIVLPNSGDSCTYKIAMTANALSTIGDNASSASPSFRFESYSDTSTTSTTQTSATGNDDYTVSYTIQETRAQLSLPILVSPTTSTTLASVIQSSTPNPRVATYSVSNIGGGPLVGTIGSTLSVAGLTFTPDAACNNLAVNASCQITVTMDTTSVISQGNLSASQLTYSDALGARTNAAMIAVDYSVISGNLPIITMSMYADNCQKGTLESGQTIVAPTVAATCDLNTGRLAPVLHIKFTNSSGLVGAKAFTANIATLTAVLGTSYNTPSTNITNNCNNITLESTNIPGASTCEVIIRPTATKLTTSVAASDSLSYDILSSSAAVAVPYSYVYGAGNIAGNGTSTVGLNTTVVNPVFSTVSPTTNVVVGRQESSSPLTINLSSWYNKTAAITPVNITGLPTGVTSTTCTMGIPVSGTESSSCNVVLSATATAILGVATISAGATNATSGTQAIKVRDKLVWTRESGATGATVQTFVIATLADGTTYLGGQTSKSLIAGYTMVGASDYWIAKYSESGLRLWTRESGPTVAGGSLQLAGLVADSNGDVYGSGSNNTPTSFPSLSGVTNPGSNTFLVKYSSSGTLLWTKFPFGNVSTLNPPYLAKDVSNNLYATTAFDVFGGVLPSQTSRTPSSKDYVVAKYTESGLLIWARQGVRSKPASTPIFFGGISTDSSGNVYAVGATESGYTGSPQIGIIDYFIMKYDTNGNFQWTKQVGVAGGTTFGYNVTTDAVGNSYVVGITNKSIVAGYTQTANSTEGFVAKYDTNGNLIWTMQLGAGSGGPASAVTYARGVTLDSANNLYVSGKTNIGLYGQTLTGTEDYFIAKYDNASNPTIPPTRLYVRQVGAAGTNSYARGVSTDSLGNAYLAGQTTGAISGQTRTGTQDYFIAQYR